MNTHQRDVKRVRKPEKISEALSASSAYVLRKAFQNDPTVRRLIKARKAVVPLIARELKANGLKLDDITLACYAYVLHGVNEPGALGILAGLFSRAMEKPPGVFFTHFAAHALRQAAGLRTRPTEFFYSPSELQETLEYVKRIKV